MMNRRGGNGLWRTGLVEAKLVSELVLADSVGVVDLVAEDEERSLGQILH